MKPIVFLLIAVFIFSCSQEKESKKDSANSPKEEVQKEEVKENPKPYIVQSGDNVFIAIVNDLEGSDEIAINLAFRKGIDWNIWFNSKEGKLDEIVYTNDLDYTRYRIPNALMEQYFETEELKKIMLYSADNEFLGTASFVRYEYVAQNVRELHAAVYRLDSEMENPKYCVAGLKEALPKMGIGKTDFEYVYDFAEENTAKNDFTIGNKLQFSFGDYIYTYLEAFNEENYKVIANLFETKNSKTKLIMGMENNELIYHIQPLAIEYNGRPVLLLEMGVDGTCAYMTNIYIRKKGKYQTPEHWGRITE